MRIIFTGGGTAGHIFPIIAIIRELKRKYPNKGFEFFYIGPKDDFVFNLLEEEDVDVRTISAGKLRRYFSGLNILDFFKIPVSLFQCLYYIFIISPDLIFSKGGYGSLPVVLMGKIFFVPIFLHESDVYPGLANRIASKLALEIFSAFPVEKTSYFPSGKMISVGNPVRRELINGSMEQAKRIFNFKGGKPIVLVLGGSQGAQRLNDVMLNILSDGLKSFELIHQTGDANFEQIKKESDFLLEMDGARGLKDFYHPFGFLGEELLPHAYAAADIVISRAGAGSIFEIAANSKPCLLIPLKGSANEHQLKNAYAYAENGAAIIFEEENFKPHFFLERLKFFLSSPKKLKEMSEKAKEFAKPNSAEIIAEYVFAYLEQ